MAHYIDKSALVAEIEKIKNSVPHYVTLAEKDSYIDGVNDALNKIYAFEVKEYSEEYDVFLGKELKMVNDEIARLEKLKVKEMDLELITGWFDHIAQIADNRMTLTNQRMTDAHALDEIKCLAKDGSEFITKHYKAQEGE